MKTKKTFIFKALTFDVVYEIITRTENRIEAYSEYLNRFSTFENIDGVWYAIYPGTLLNKKDHKVRLVGV